MTNNDKASQAAIEKGKLLPCPFCDSKTAMVVHGTRCIDGVTDDLTYVSCGQCHARSGRASGGKKLQRIKMVTTAWNTRPSASVAQDRDGVLDEAIEEASRVGIQEPLSLQADPYIRGAVDARQIIVNALIALRGESDVSYRDAVIDECAKIADERAQREAEVVQETRNPDKMAFSNFLEKVFRGVAADIRALKRQPKEEGEKSDE